MANRIKLYVGGVVSSLASGLFSYLVYDAYQDYNTFDFAEDLIRTFSRNQTQINESIKTFETLKSGMLFNMGWEIPAAIGTAYLAYRLFKKARSYSKTNVSTK